VTHDQEEALSMADQVAVMRDGRIVQHGPPAEVYRHPADLWVAGFVGSANILAGVVVEAGRGMCSLGPVTVETGPAAGPVDLVVRPEQVRFVGAGGAAGVVEHREYHGHDALVRVGLADGSTVMVRAQAGDVPAAGTTVAVACAGPVAAFRADR
ncbi:MAG: TOBE domain-containing protein, partial [Acidimicrobiales bacterium]